VRAKNLPLIETAKNVERTSVHGVVQGHLRSSWVGALLSAASTDLAEVRIATELGQALSARSVGQNRRSLRQIEKRDLRWGGSPRGRAASRYRRHDMTKTIPGYFA